MTSKTWQKQTNKYGVRRMAKIWKPKGDIAFMKRRFIGFTVIELNFHLTVAIEQLEACDASSVKRRL